jgi:hypothetical protein
MNIVAGLVFGAACILGIAGCGTKEEPKLPHPPAVEAPAPQPAVTAVVFGKGVDIAWNAVSPQTEFSPKDRVNAVITTENAAPGHKLSVQWFYLDTNQQIRADSVELKEQGTNHSTFFIERAKGWPPGQYRLDVQLNGVQVRSAAFTVR